MSALPITLTAPPRYQQTAAWLVQSIEQGIFSAGERLPSVREVCRHQAISLTTALAAYRLLEREGWVVARPKSGYFVSTRPAAPPEVEHASCGAAAQLVGVSALVNTILAAGRGAAERGVSRPVAVPRCAAARHCTDYSAHAPRMFHHLPTKPGRAARTAPPDCAPRRRIRLPHHA